MRFEMIWLAQTKINNSIWLAKVWTILSVKRSPTKEISIKFEMKVNSISNFVY
ncbi:hypothetical protein IKD82_01785 [Candidatus Saccharibacteria bacterium]|nr:hypothetical protein [Candidatus Saccharibacteria bacterium]